MFLAADGYDADDPLALIDVVEVPPATGPPATGPTHFGRLVKSVSDFGDAGMPEDKDERQRRRGLSPWRA